MFWKPKYIAKDGFLIPHDGGNMSEATLLVYPNGTMIVKTENSNYQVTGYNGTVYEVNSCLYPRFIVTE